MGSSVLRIEVSSTSLRMELSMSDTKTVSPLRQRMIDDMAARKLNPHTQRSHISSCKRFAAWLKRSPDTATPERSLPSRGPTSRDFVPWRFLDACQLSVPRPSLLPASKNLHNCRHSASAPSWSEASGLPAHGDAQLFEPIYCRLASQTHHMQFHLYTSGLQERRSDWICYPRC